VLLKAPTDHADRMHRGVVRHVTIALALSAFLAGCERNEPVAGGQPLSHWAREARRYSIMPWWNSSRDERRHVAFEKLLEIGEPAVPTLLELLGSDNPSISGDALNALTQLGPRARSAVPELVRMLQSDRQNRGQAAWVLGRIGPDAASAVPALTAALRDPDHARRESAAQALGQIGGPGREALERAARDADGRVRESSVGGLAVGRKDVESKRAYLSAVLEDPDPAVRAKGLRSVSPRTREEAEALVDLLVRGMNDESEDVRKNARQAFIGLREYQVTTRFLVEVMRSGDAESRADAAWQLGNRRPTMDQSTGREASETARALRGALHDREAKVRIYAARALWAADPGARDAVAETLRDAMPVVDVELKVRAARVLWQVRHDPAEVLGSYEEGLSAENRWRLYETLEAIFEMGAAAEPLRPALERLSEDSDREVKRRAEITLAALGARP